MKTITHKIKRNVARGLVEECSAGVYPPQPSLPVARLPDGQGRQGQASALLGKVNTMKEDYLNLIGKLSGSNKYDRTFF